MFHRVALALAFVSALTGCAGAPKGPFVEYHDGVAAVTRSVTCEATYALHSANDPSVPLAEHHVMKGERIGFRCERDGSVWAIGPGYILSLSSGGYSWDMVPGSSLKWYERMARDARDPALAAKEATWAAICGTALLLGAVVLIIFVFKSKDSIITS